MGDDLRGVLVTTAAASSLDFDGLTIEYDDRVLVPRPWTVTQSHWARELLADVPEGPVLELCSGVGHIGLAAVAGTGRTLVMVDRDEHAAELSRRNAVQVAETCEVRCAALETALGPQERFPMVLADPPWVPTAEVVRFPEDPVPAIDGGHDGLGPAQACLRVGAAHLAAGGEMILQLGDVDQAGRLAPAVEELELTVVEVREESGGTLVRLRRVEDGPAPGRTSRA